MKISFLNSQLNSQTPSPFPKRESVLAPSLSNLPGKDSFQPVRFGEQYGNEKKIWSFNEAGDLTPAVSSLDEITTHDVEEYLLSPSNYGNENIQPEDREIIEKLIKAFKNDGLFNLLKKSFAKEIKTGEPLQMASIGHADLYPALLLNGVGKLFDTENYHIDLVDYIRASREILYRSLYGTQIADLPLQESLWNKYRDLMEEKGGALWRGRFNDLRDHGRIVQGSMMNLPKEKYHAAFSFFAADSITDTVSGFEKAIQSYVDSVKQGGLLAGALMTGSSGWGMGKCWMPGVPLTKEIVENAFRKAGAYVTVTQIDTPPQIRDGYDGMLIYSGIKALR